MTRSPGDPLPELASTELDVMKVLWRRGRLSAREVHEAVEGELGWAYSTTRTVLERLVGKGAVAKGRFHGLTLYEPKISKARGLAQRVKDFAHRVLETEVAPVVSLFAQSEALTEEEMGELEALLVAGGEEKEDRVRGKGEEREGQDKDVGGGASR